MKIAVFGLGYVGCVGLGCLAQNGHYVTGVDVNDDKIRLINNGVPTIIEKDIDTIIRNQWRTGKISATNDFRKAVLDTDAAFICVGTPSLPTGQLDLQYVFETARQIGEALRDKNGFYVVAIRSTVMPGTNNKVGEIITGESGKLISKDFAIVSNPEFLREGSAVEDFYNPAITVLGSDSDRALNLMEEIYKGINAPVVRTDTKAAEFIKYVNNAFHALKISFSNEIGNICKTMEIDSFSVMELFKMDYRLNISKAYFNPGMAYGGSCLPKDLKGLVTIAHDRYVQTPLIEAIGRSNEVQKERVFEMVYKRNATRIGIFGLAFKKGTDDLRYSPSVDLTERLLGKGYELKIYDRNVSLAFLTGANKRFLNEHLPHITNLLVDDLKELVRDSEIIVLTHKPEQSDYEVLSCFKGTVIDLVRINLEKLKGVDIEGLSW
jgi:GDP-mannose 6-dehydrogenase